MKYFLGFLAGCACGTGLAAAVLYYNPLTGVAAPADGGEQWLRYDSPVGNNLALTHGGELSVPASPATIPNLWESTIEGTTLLLVELRSADGSLFGVGSRISALSENTELLWKGVGLDSYWTVSAPGRGSFFVIQEENIWPVLKEVILPTGYRSQGWRGNNTYALNTGPLDSGHGLLLGATGEFRDQQGLAQERYDLRRYSTTEGPVDMGAALGIILAHTEQDAVDPP